MQKIIVIIGPTASGKSDLAVKVAERFAGEVISADSRQVYRGLDIGSGKITEEEKRGIKHHLLDVVAPDKVFSAAHFKKLGEEAIKQITRRGRVPIVCGGTGFYVQALVDSFIFPKVAPNKKLRALLAQKTTLELARILRKTDKRRYAEIDKNNRHRLIRAIEIAQVLGRVPKIRKAENNLAPLFIGISLPDEILRAKIKKRLLARLRQGMIEEVKDLHAGGLSWQRLEDFGLEYRAVAEYLQKKTTKKKMIERLEIDIWKFAKRQRVWFKRDKRIKWFDPRDWSGVEKAIGDFIAES